MITLFKKLVFLISAPFFLCYYYLFYSSRLKKVSEDIQVFLLSRQDFGTILILLHYIRCWHTQRSNTCLVVLASRYKLVKELAQVICPSTIVICPDNLFSLLIAKTYGHLFFQSYLMGTVYAQLLAERPNSLFIFEQLTRFKQRCMSNYIKHLDERLSYCDDNGPFHEAYLETRKILNSRSEIVADYMKLHYSLDLKAPLIKSEDKTRKLLRLLNVKNRYIVLHINSKNYKHAGASSRTVGAPQTYNCMIDYLLAIGYDVVIQGREEQPRFESRAGLIDYSKCEHRTPENDLLLYSGCEFAIVSKTGTELCTTVCNVPALGLNYTELCGMQPNLKFRFYPKRLKNLALGREISWKELLENPIFFRISQMSAPGFEYIDMSEEELVEALKEFLVLLAIPGEEKWLNYTPLQQEFKNALNPLHMDMYHIKGVPCDSYLKRTSR